MAVDEKDLSSINTTLQVVNVNAGPNYVGVRKQITIVDDRTSVTSKPYLIIKMIPYTADNPMVAIRFDVANYGYSIMNGTGLIQCYMYRSNNRILDAAAHYSGVGFSGNITFDISSDSNELYIIIPRGPGGYGLNTYNRWFFDFSCTTVGLGNGSLWTDPDKISIYPVETMPTLNNPIEAAWTKWT